MSYTHSEELRRRLRYQVNDHSSNPDDQVWSETEIDGALVDAFGYVTYGERTESSGSSLDISLAKLWAGATLLGNLARDNARLAKWKTAAGEEHDAGQISKNIDAIAGRWFDQVERALKRQNDRLRDDIKTEAPAGAPMNWNTLSAKHRDITHGTVDRLNRPYGTTR